MATDWYMEGPYIKNCSCDPGCPCDFNSYPTKGHCEGMAGMRIDKGHFGDTDLSGLACLAVEGECLRVPIGTPLAEMERQAIFATTKLS